MTADVPSTLKRPTARQISSFRASMIGPRDTIRAYLEKGWSLVICCKDCPRMIEWTPPELLEKFADKLGLPIADLVPRLSCKGEGGCGFAEVAVFPHRYDGEWTWPKSQ
ncbi:MAG: hypothetical protein ABIO39_06290 [Caulobacteraceae bacterium]